MTNSEYIWDYLHEQGVNHVFTLAGGGSMFLLDALGRNRRISPVYCLHEQAVGIAAEAYAQYKGLGVALVTTGPGGTNMVTPVVAAWIDSTPLLVISGQVYSHQGIPPGSKMRQMGPQEVDIVSIVRPITKMACTVVNVQFYLPKAVEIAREHRMGPVWLDIPLDVQSA